MVDLKATNSFHQLSNQELEQSPSVTRKKKKTVQWQSQDKLEEIKYFKMNDEPNAPGLSIDEVVEIQKHLADVPVHLIPSAI